MSEQLRMYTRAVYGFDHVARLAGSGDWDRPAPCDGWTTRHVVGHVVAVHRFIHSRLIGVEPSLDPFTAVEEHAGADPYATWAALRDDVLEALDQPGVLQRVVQSFNGDRVVNDLVGFNVIDTTVHSWDLARALGVDERLDPAQVAWSTALGEPAAPRLRAGGMFGPEVEIGTDADPQLRLLAITGREPR